MQDQIAKYVESFAHHTIAQHDASSANEGNRHARE